MKCVIKRPYAEAHKGNISNDLGTLQSIVNGNIEVLPVPHKDLWLICNEEGKINGLEANIYVEEYNDCIVGTIICVDATNDGDFTDMSESDCTEMVQWLNNHDAIKLIQARMRK